MCRREARTLPLSRFAWCVLGQRRSFGRPVQDAERKQMMFRLSFDSRAACRRLDGVSPSKSWSCLLCVAEREAAELYQVHIHHNQTR